MKISLILITLFLSSCNFLAKTKVSEAFFKSKESVTNTVGVSVPTISYTGAAGTTGSVGVAMSVTPTTLNDNGSAITNCDVSPALSVGLSINASNCVIFGTPTGPLAATTYNITATNSVGTSSAASVTIFVCPANYATVSANTYLGVNAFCVAQFEMKCVGTSCPTGIPDANAVATSLAAQAPWVSIDQTNAKTACTNLNAINGVINKYDLISNPEWMTIAHEIETTATNWSSGVVGAGMLNRGWSANSASDGFQNSAVASSTGAGCLYNTAANTCGATGDHKLKRTHTLSNGQIIWDIAGNVFEWTDWSLGGGLTSGPTSCTAAWTELPVVSCGALAAADYMPANPASVTANSYNSNYGLGQFYGGSGGAAVRGGHWTHGALAGAFTLAVLYSPSSSYANVGFRCVFRP